MAFSSGTFSRLHDWTTDRDAGIKISASRTDAEFDGIATGLTTCILKDGTQTLTAMIPFTLGLSVPTDKKIQLRDSAIFINSSADGQLNMAADTSVTITTPSLIITDNTTDEPIVQIKNTHNGTTAGELRFVMDKGAAGADGDDLGTISFFGDDAGQNQTAFAKIVGEVSEADETDEAGKLSFFVAESDGTNTALTAGLILEGEHATDGEVDVTIGAGVASTTSVAGVLNVAGGAVFNEASADVDFRVESNGEENMFLVDGGNDAVIMGHSAKVDGINDDNEGVKGSGGHLQLHGATPCIDVFSYSTTNGTHGGINFMKSRNNTVGSTTVITTGDVIGSIAFGGFDGADYASIMGKIDFQAGGSGMAENDTAGEMVFYTTPDGSGGGGSSERMRIESGGDVKIASGDIYFSTAGKGIVLGATSNTDANTLDSYEEGTFSPSADSFSGTMTFTTANYVKIGKLVHVNFKMTSDGNGDTDQISISGFPFSAVAEHPVCISDDMAGGGALQSNTTPSIANAMINTAEIMYVYLPTGGAFQYAFMGTGFIRVSGTYITT